MLSIVVVKVPASCLGPKVISDHVYGHAKTPQVRISQRNSYYIDAWAGSVCFFLGKQPRTNGKLVVWGRWFGYVWIPRIPLSKGLLFGDTPIQIPNHRAPNHQFTITGSQVIVRHGLKLQSSLFPHKHGGEWLRCNWI